MADTDRQQQTETPTQKRLEEARERGQVPRSRDLSAASVVLAGGFGLYNLGQYLGGGLLAMMRSAMTASAAPRDGDGYLLAALGSASAQAAVAVAPLLGLLLAAAVLAPLAIGGWNFSVSALQPRWERLDPGAGLGRVFSLHGLIELGKALARFLVVAVVAFLLLHHQYARFANLSTEPLGAAIAHALSLTGVALIALGGALAAIAAVDVPLALWQHQRSLRMSREEIREETRDTEGSPEVRGRIRRTQQELARRRMMAEVPRADVVITNPHALCGGPALRRAAHARAHRGGQGRRPGGPAHP